MCRNKYGNPSRVCFSLRKKERWRCVKCRSIELTVFSNLQKSNNFYLLPVLWGISSFHLKSKLYYISRTPCTSRTVILLQRLHEAPRPLKSRRYILFYKIYYSIRKRMRSTWADAQLSSNERE